MRWLPSRLMRPLAGTSAEPAATPATYPTRAVAQCRPRAISALTTARLKKIRLLVMMLAKTPPSLRNALTSSDPLAMARAINANLVSVRTIVGLPVNACIRFSTGRSTQNHEGGEGEYRADAAEKHD